MARRRFRRAARRIGARVRRYGRRSSGSSGAQLIQADSVVYGALRPLAANLIAPVASMLPLGAYADEVAMGLVNWFVAKRVGGMIGNVARKGLVVENAMIGSALGAGLLGGGTAPTQSSNVMYG